jgi:hypothetical protein
MASEIVARLEATGDHRSLGRHEESLWKELKLKPWDFHLFKGPSRVKNRTSFGYEKGTNKV